jgi:hypothetical protein
VKHARRIPAWLLRDFPARASMIACFSLFGIHLISAGSTPSQTRSWLQKQRWPTHRGAVASTEVV